MIAEYTLFFIITTLITSVLLNLYDEKQILKNTYVECSKVSVKDCEFGLGVFANKNLKKNEIVEVGVMTILKNVDGNENEHLFTWSNDKKTWACGSGCLAFYNHSNSPNVIKVGDIKNNKMKVVALRDIKKGEELRNRYFSATWRDCFQCLR